MKISVTIENISDGLLGRPGYCPIALAINQSGYENAYVVKNEFYCYRYEGKDYKRYHGKLPDEAKEFIKYYDKAKFSLIYPFEFNVDLVEDS